MVQSLNYLRESPSQTAGPSVHIGLVPRAAGIHTFAQQLGQVIAADGVPGERIRVEGVVFDGTGAPGIYPHPEDLLYGHTVPGFRGWGRVISDFDSGFWGFDTIKPGSVAGRASPVQAPHISFWLVSRGINIGLNTRMYFADEGAANAVDPVIGSIEQRHRTAPPR